MCEIYFICNEEAVKNKIKKQKALLVVQKKTLKQNHESVASIINYLSFIAIFTMSAKFQQIFKAIM